MAQTLRSSIKGVLNRSIKSGLLKPAQFRGSTLDLDFAGAKSLKNQIGNKDVVTFTRASSGTYVDGDGIIQSASTNTARFDHDPATGESLGLLVEEARTNTVNKSERDFGAASAIETENVVVAPDGNTTADQFESTGGGAFKGGITVTNGAKVTYSVFLKKISGSGIMTSVGFNAFGSTNVAAKVDVDLNNGTISNPDALVEDSSITAYSNGWYRVSVTATATDTTATVVNYCDTNNTPHTFSVWGMQVEEGSFPTSYIPTDGTTVTRAADVAEITGNDFGTFNLAQYSEHVTGWNIKANVNVSLDQETAPDGTRTADKVAENTATIEHYIEERVTSGVSGVYTHSVFVKAAGRTSVFMRPVHIGESSNTSSCIFDLTTGTAGTPTGLSSNPTIEAYPDGWYRIALSVTLTGANTTHALRIHVYNGSALNYQGDGTSGYFVWGSQVEESSTVTPYVKSDVTFTSRASTATYYDVNGLIQTAAVDEARTAAYLPDENGNFISAGELLLEDASTNQFAYSNSAANGETWNNVGGGFNLTAGYSDPAGGTDAIAASDADNATSGTFLQRTNLLNTTAGTTVTYSVWLKPVDAPIGLIYLNLFSNGTADVITGRFLVSGTEIISVSAEEGGTGNNLSSSFQKFPDGWYRCSVAGVVSTVDMSDVRARINAGNYQRVQDTVRFYWYGAQLEESSYVTSYIPTSGSTATRAADVSSSSSNTFGNSFYNQSEGTMFADAFVNHDIPSSDFPAIFNCNSGSQTDRVATSFITNTASGQIVSVGGVNTVSSFPAGLTGVRRRKTAAGFAVDNYYVITNNLISQAVSDSSGNMPNNLTQANIGLNANGTYYTNGTISRITYWPQRLPDATLQTITT